jgi:choline kinase
LVCACYDGAVGEAQCCSYVKIAVRSVCTVGGFQRTLYEFAVSSVQFVELIVLNANVDVYFFHSLKVVVRCCCGEVVLLG